MAFVLVRALAKQDYAWFTIASSMSAVLNALNDGGVATAVISMGGAIWQDRRRFSALITAAYAMLWRAALLGGGVMAPLLAWLLREKDASWQTMVILVVLVVGPQWLANRTFTLSSVNRLHSRIRELQVAELAAASTRFVLTLVPAALGFVNVYLALGAAVIGLVVQSMVVRRQVVPLLDLPGEEAEVREYRGHIGSVMKSMYPNVVFTCVQSQLATGLLAVFGSTSQVADLGALSRLSFFANFIGAPVHHIIGPAFARCSDARRLRWLFVGVLTGYLVVLGAFVGFVGWQAGFVLQLFGSKYAHLNHELFLVAVAVAMMFINLVFSSLNFSRGWVRWTWINIPLTLAVQSAAAFFLRMDTVEGAAYLMIATACANLVLSVTIAYLELFRLRGHPLG